MDQSPGGIWTSQYTVTSGANTGDVIQAEGIVSETGQYFAYSKDTTTGCAGLEFGQLSVSGANATGTGNSAMVRYSTMPGGATNCVYPDGSTSATGTLAGQVAARASLMVTATGTTSLGSALIETTNYTFSSLYLNPSSLAAIAGNYNDGGLNMTLDANGAVFEQGPNGCVMSGQVSIINASYNAYGIQLTFANCTGTSAGLNGVVASGLLTLDTATSPATVIGGISGSIGGELFVEAFNLARM
ncbi:MAG TPA: hypothetical protein VK652_11440 [Steroidobacteraceae bacterium]|nr:hypothetical protein [Steroidobacteraceae bacterium]